MDYQQIHIFHHCYYSDREPGTVPHRPSYDEGQPRYRIQWDRRHWLPETFDDLSYVSQGRSTPYFGDGYPTLEPGNPFNSYINPYYWADDHPLTQGQTGSLDPSTYLQQSGSVYFSKKMTWEVFPRPFLGGDVIHSAWKTGFKGPKLM